jgi:hypothetical protein
MMMKIAHSLIALSFVGTLLLAGSVPTVAKTSYVYGPSYQVPAPRCAHGTWDPYGKRCDSSDG